MVRRIDLQQNSVADDYRFSSAALSMFRFDMTLDMCLSLVACLKFQKKEGILSSGPHPLCHQVITCHLLADPPPSPSSDDVIYEQPLKLFVHKNRSVEKG